MWYIIIAIFVIGVIVVLAKYVLFHPQVNSVVSIICLFWALIKVYIPSNISGLGFCFLFLFPVIDCVRDIIIAPKYYADIEYELDKLYVIKSLTSLFTAGVVRNVFFFIVDPHIARSVRRSLKREIRDGRRLTGSTGRHGEHIGWRVMSGARWYHFNKQVKRLEKNGIVISNGETGIQEIEKAKKKLEGLYPKKLVDSILEKVTNNEDVELKKSIRRRSEGLLRLGTSAVYLPTSTYEKIPQLVREAMSDKGVCPLYEIKFFPELQSLNLVKPLKDSDNSWYEKHADRWFDYFIIQALQPLVADGTFEDNDFNDNDPLDCHAYRYTMSTKQMPSHGPETDPKWAIDDDDD